MKVVDITKLSIENARCKNHRIQMQIKFHNIFQIVAYKALEIQSHDGWMPPGHNGPYYDQETPIRNTAHWLITFFKAFDLTGDNRFYLAAIKCSDYLINNQDYRKQHNFIQRVKESKDDCNGLIGPAWVIESLYEAYRRTKNEKILQLCYHLYSLHPFDKKIGLWKIVSSKGEILGFDNTFNHQLWFFAACHPLQRHFPIMRETLDTFNKKLDKHLKINLDGRIKHHVQSDFKSSIKACVKSIIRINETRILALKEIGYQTFNLYALAEIEHLLNDSVRKKVEKAKRYLLSDQYGKKIAQSEYGYGYNAPGFEIPYIFKNEQEFTDKWLSKQIQFTYDKRLQMFSRRTTDRVTLTARVYECAKWL